MLQITQEDLLWQFFLVTIKESTEEPSQEPRKLHNKTANSEQISQEGLILNVSDL